MADYYYTDANRQPAGPVPYERLDEMYEAGLLAHGALVAEVGADAWQPVADLLGHRRTSGSRSTAPPVAPTGPIAASTTRFEPLAGWAFGLGVGSWVCLSIFGAIPGVILGHMALGRIRKTGNTDGTSKVLAIIGLVASYACLAIMVGALIIGLGFGLLGAFGP